jgi:hypothetical protein
MAIALELAAVAQKDYFPSVEAEDRLPALLQLAVRLVHPSH